MALSDDRQADVNNRLCEQALEALQLLLTSFEAAARRDGEVAVREGLLTVVLRLSFTLHAEARGLLPVEHLIYAGNFGVNGLLDALVGDADAHGDTMDQRFGAWPRLLELFRALYFGLEQGDLSITPHRGKLFDPEQHSFLGEWAPDDSVVLRVLRRLSFVGGQRLDYSALEEEQLGNIYEASMGQQRRRTSSHYTPRSLSGPIVRRTLEPLLAARPNSEDLLDLQICDPAMGAGAFLLESCRFLAGHVVEAWLREGSLDAAAGEDLALRMVAQRCLLGVDKNPLAVELAKLSLWLLTRGRGQPFTFLDHRLEVGDSLVGLSRAQILALDWARDQETNAQMGIAADETPHSRERLRDVGDIVLSSWFFPFDGPEELSPEFLFGTTKVTDKHRRECLARLRKELNVWLTSADSSALPEPLEVRRKLVRECVRPMHWEIEFPEVTSVDAVVGNPPFSGKNGITEVNGTQYLNWLTHAYTPSHGNSDLSAYFFRRADWLLGAHGTMGLIATNTIGQGDTRNTGLEPIVAGGGRIYDATRSFKWPVGIANVSVSVVHIAKGHDGLPARLDGEPVHAISTRLRAAIERSNPAQLPANKNRSFQGAVVLGKGFVLTPDERDRLASKNGLNAQRMFPYVGGQELNSSPTLSHERYVISFGDLDIERAAAWPDLLDHVRKTVKPERDRNNRESYRKYWWQFAEKRPALTAALELLPRCLVCSRVSKWCVFAFQPTDRVFSEATVVFALQDHAHFGLLQSRVHERWARLHASSMRNDLRYTPSECFETFPFPDPPTLAPDAPLEAIAARLYETRAAYMLDTNQGLTKTYNALTDRSLATPQIEHLRHLHEELDRAVLDAYGQPNIPVPPYAGTTPEQLERFEDAVLEFLFARNSLLARTTSG